MLKRLFQFIKNLFQGLFGSQKKSSIIKKSTQPKSPPPLEDTDLEFLFAELLEGVHQARGQSWAIKWLHNLRERVQEERWLEWLKGFEKKLLSSSNPNNELASRMVQLGELDIGVIGDTAHDIGMKLLTRNQTEPVWEYDGPDDMDLDHQGTNLLFESPFEDTSSPENGHGNQQEYPENDQLSETNLPEGEYQTVSLEQLYEMIQEDQNLRQMIAQQLEVETDDPELIMRKLINQFHATN
ncbi:MAG: hypothetical protein AAF208_01970 [Cyanobacteria bacterium P01_A01_bin.45]